ncbi:hypothetical protein [Halogeometricum luteum]|uniref:DUF4190 domain-containing protein n=1 Tax=Halogeometricum luteum TaxID=2950537 RepID=A0ABU2G139_9EURY|nr:hypothetical protein [Halogeometricum sp. S3BR5-2]MDS0294500.1 hypothetical protein [Halogeometricum sp. S3BR5-2]
MPLTDSVPGMRAESPVRNALLAVAYLGLLPVVIAFLPAALAVVVGLNVCGAADRLSALPGVGEGGVVAAGVGAGVGFALLAALGVVLPDGPETDRREIPGAAVFESRSESSSSVSASDDSAFETELDSETRV